MALIFHPDKAPRDKENEYHVKFQSINEAFQMLSNPNERAWYDQHRDQYLNPNRKMDNFDGFTFDIDQFIKKQAFQQQDEQSTQRKFY